MLRLILIGLYVFFVSIAINIPASAQTQFPAVASQSQNSSVASNSNIPAPQPPAQYTLSPERYQKAIAYSRKRYVLYFASFAVSVLALLIVLSTGLAAKYRDCAERCSGHRFLQALLFVPLLLFTLSLFDLPLQIYSHVLALRYEQSVQHWGSWLGDWCKEELLTIGFAIILVLLFFAVFRRSPRRWWFYFGLAALPIILFVTFLSPWFIDPLFNQFVPLQNRAPALVTALEQVVHRTGLQIPPQRMFLMLASAKTNEVNAYVTGFGASKRVVVWDTTLQKLSTHETLFVFGHELGHYVLGHLRTGFLFFAALLFVGLYVANRGWQEFLDRWGHHWKIYGLEDWAALAVLLLVSQILMFVAEPAANSFSRMQEHHADIYGLEVIHGIVANPQKVAAQSFQTLGEIDLADPNPPPFIKFWLYTHPPLAERIFFVSTYDPWSRGEKPKYVQ